MSDIKVYFEIGHKAQVRSKLTPEGFTHDWEVFVRGQEGADIGHFVDKVVFVLHETFPKPRRVVKDPPFCIKESGYAGFIIPVEIYLKNKDEPKKIDFQYDFRLERQEGLLKDRYIFKNPNDEFKKKLLRGGGIVSNIEYYDSFTEEKAQILSKSKMSESTKKHKSKEHKEDLPYKNSNFESLFGPPIQKPPKVSPDAKKIEKPNAVVKSEKKDKDSSSSDKKSKHEHKESKPEKARAREEMNKKEKIKNHTKEQEKPKDKVSKRPSEKPPLSPEPAKKKRTSPSRKPPSPSARSNSSSSVKEEFKPQRLEQSKPKIEEKPVDVKVEKEKKKKDKKSHDKDKERKEKKEHKKESNKVKDSPKEPPKEVPKEIPKPRDIVKEKEPAKESIKEKGKLEKSVNKFSIENLKKSPPPEPEERNENHKGKEKGDSERKHKHKKKDKKRDESREKHKEERNKDKKHKHDKARELPPEKLELFERRETPVPKERPQLEPQSPISIDTASQCSSKSGLAKTSNVGAEDVNSAHSDSEASVIAYEDEPKPKVEKTSPEPPKREPSPEPDPDIEPDAEPAAEPQPVPHRHKEKSKKHKDKSAKREEKRRKRKAAEEEDIENRKLAKTAETAPINNDLECGESSGSMSIETKVQDNGVSSSLGEDAEPGDLSPDYMVQLRGLQQRIMKIKNNEDLERVVNLIAETGRYEVTTQTFDFDLCLLDRSTVQQLIQLVGC